VKSLKEALNKLIDVMVDEFETLRMERGKDLDLLRLEFTQRMEQCEINTQKNNHYFTHTLLDIQNSI